MGYVTAAQAYGALDPALSTPTTAEARVFDRVTRRLSAAFADDTGGPAARASALHDNRRLWLAAVGDLAGSGNALPDALRAQLIGLAGFVDRQTSAVLDGRGDVAVLIEINSRISAGLASSGR